MTEQTNPSTQLLLDQAEIIRVVDGIDDAVDAKDWVTCRGYFLEEIYIDFSSRAGDSPGRMAAGELVGAWSANLYSVLASTARS
ncbi:MAG: hypothetical protein JOZ19_06050 [Rubrobacter sp.]|nr:hypothetical protein [Rubrobacter sp.]